MPRIILTASGFDPSGGAGVGAEIKTARALGFHAVSVITALTVQNTCGAKSVYAIDAEIISEQIETLLDDFEVSGVKISVIPSAEIAETLKRWIRKIDAVKILDPVISAGAGGKLGNVEAYRILLDSVDVITPNFQEARILAGFDPITGESRVEEAEKISSLIFDKYGCAVIITGGELRGKDLVFEGKRKYFVEADFSPVQIHGTGCVYSTALACYLASGKSLEDAARLARIFVLESVKRAVRVGKCFPAANP